MIAIPPIEEMIRGIPRSLGSYGPVLAEIEAALDSPQCSLGTVGEAIEKEPDLTARLLRLANSAFYGYSSRLSTVTEAISLMGIQQVQDLIVASSIIQRFSGVPKELVDMKSFWQHSLACGVAARTLALERRLPKADKFFVGGLLHDIGRLVLYSQAPLVAQQVFEVYGKEPMLLTEAEARVMGYDHQGIGGELLQHWNYPAFLVQAVACHHQPNSARQAMAETAVVHVADFVVGALQIGSSGERRVPTLSAKSCAILGLTPEGIGRLVTTIDEQIEAVQEVFLSE